MFEQAKRDLVVKLAREWLRTPYHNNAGIKGVGVDCAWIIYEVYREAGLCGAVQIPQYSPQWFMHRGEELYLNLVLQNACEIPQEEAREGDIVLYRIGRLFAHGGIMTSPTSIIHAYKEGGMVMESGIKDGRLADLKTRFFSAMAG